MKTLILFLVLGSATFAQAGYYDGPAAKAEACRSVLERTWHDSYYKRTGVLISSGYCTKFSPSEPYGVGMASAGRCRSANSELNRMRTVWKRQCDRLHKANFCNPNVREIMRRYGEKLEDCGN